jgi:hypothetical protein
MKAFLFFGRGEDRHFELILGRFGQNWEFYDKIVCTFVAVPVSGY